MDHDDRNHRHRTANHTKNAPCHRLHNRSDAAASATTNRTTRTATTKQLLLVIVCIVAVQLIGSADGRQRTSHPRPPVRNTVLNLCSKDVDMKLACHCSMDEASRRTVVEADCLVLHNEFPQSDAAWLSFRQHPNLQHFTLTVHRNGYMSYLPSDVLQIQRELRSVTITYADIREIPQFAFGNLTRLENITLARSQIEVLDPNAFANLASLVMLNLEENQIVQMDAHAFGHLPELLELVLTKNNISALHEDMFERLGKLQRLRLAENLVADLTRDVFKGLGNLRLLDMSFNNLRFLRDTVFAELWSMQELDLESNAIERLSERAFDGLNNLRILNLRNNKLQTLESGVFTGVPALSMLSLQANLLETLTFDNVMPLMDNLVNNTLSTLDISDNKFVCDCRLAWLYDLRVRTRNIAIRRTTESVICSMRRHAAESATFTHSSPPDNGYNGLNVHLKNNMPQPYELSNTYPIVAYDAFGNELTDQHYQQQRLEPQTPAATSPDAGASYPSGAHTYTVTLTTIGAANLPCPRSRAVEPTELPLPRESIGLDLSWLSAVGTNSGGSASAASSLSTQHRQRIASAWCCWWPLLVLSALVMSASRDAASRWIC